MTTANRPFSLKTKLAGINLHVRSFTGEEAISKLFRFRILAHSDSYVAAADLLGQDVTFVVEPGFAVEPGFELAVEPGFKLPVEPGFKHAFAAKPRLKHARSYLATIACVEELGTEQNRAVYALELVPRLWAMTQTVRAQVFENLDPLAIIEQVAKESGVRVTTQARQPKDRVRPYCVQYFESDFDFVLRLIEEEGYVYLLEADDKGPVLAIKYFPYSPPKAGTVPFHDVLGSGSTERIASWKKTRILSATAVTARDHLFEVPSPVLEGAASEPASKWPASVDRYPGQWAHLFEELSMNGLQMQLAGYIGFGNSRAELDLVRLSGSASACEGTSNCAHLAPGSHFVLAGLPGSNGEHLVISVRHKGSQGLDYSGGRRDEFEYENQFTAVPYSDTLKYLPPRSTRKPVIHGCQTAQVVGAADKDEIWTDKHGRVQVQFWWDRAGTRSCWIRVATSWAGNNWGVQHIPRVGQEVVVTFLDGDPDRPLIVGSVYNATHPPAFDVPVNSTQSGIRTHSTPGGGADDCNEISFEDKKGEEEIYIHAQHDRSAVVENESRELVRQNRYDEVKKTLHTTLGKKCEAVAGDSDLSIGGDCMNSITGNLGISAKKISLKADTIVIEADAISIRSKSKEFIHLKSGQGITIESKGDQVWINCGGAHSPDDGSFRDLTAPEPPFAKPAK